MFLPNASENKNKNCPEAIFQVGPRAVRHLLELLAFFPPPF